MLPDNATLGTSPRETTLKWTNPTRRRHWGPLCKIGRDGSLISTKINLYKYLVKTITHWGGGIKGTNQCWDLLWRTASKGQGDPREPHVRENKEKAIKSKANTIQKGDTVTPIHHRRLSTWMGETREQQIRNGNDKETKLYNRLSPPILIHTSRCFLQLFSVFSCKSKALHRNCHV